MLLYVTPETLLLDLFCEYANWEAYMLMRVRNVLPEQLVGTHVGGIMLPDWMCAKICPNMRR